MEMPPHPNYGTVAIAQRKLGRRERRELQSELGDVSTRAHQKAVLCSAMKDALALLRLQPWGCGREIEVETLEHVSLLEVRAGPKITTRETVSSGRSFSSTSVFGVRSGSSGSSSSRSRSVTQTGPDQLRIIDVGRLALTSREIRFVGTKYTRRTVFNGMAGHTLSNMFQRLTIAPKTASKVWVAEAGEPLVGAALLLSMSVRLGKLAPRWLDQVDGHTITDVFNGLDTSLAGHMRERDELERRRLELAGRLGR